MKKIFILFILIIAQSCQMRGLTNDFGKLSANDKAKIVKLKTFENLNLNSVYKINGLQLKEEMLKYNNAIVYEFTNGCTSEFCRPLSVYENFAEKHHYKLFLVMNGFGAIEETIEQRHNQPLFAIDGDYYHKWFRATYTRYFLNELLGKPLKTKEGEYLGSIYFFTKGKLDKILMDLPNE